LKSQKLANFKLGNTVVEPLTYFQKQSAITLVSSATRLLKTGAFATGILFSSSGELSSVDRDLFLR
jgi:hypothetical protein